jgi:hypothetical protein
MKIFLRGKLLPLLISVKLLKRKKVLVNFKNSLSHIPSSFDLINYYALPCLMVHGAGNFSHNAEFNFPRRATGGKNAAEERIYVHYTNVSQINHHFR